MIVLRRRKEIFALALFLFFFQSGYLNWSISGGPGGDAGWSAASACQAPDLDDQDCPDDDEQINHSFHFAHPVDCTLHSSVTPVFVPLTVRYRASDSTLYLPPVYYSIFLPPKITA